MKSILLPAAVILSLSAFSASAQTRCVRPPFISPGDTVAIISTSFVVKDTAVIARACDVLDEWGLVPVFGANAVQKHPEYMKEKCDFYSGTPDERAAELKWAFEDPSVKAIICTRGGYGSIHLVERIEPSFYAAHPKWLVGYSDVTTVLCGEVMGGVMGIHGSMCSSFGRKTGVRDHDIMMKDLLMGAIPSYAVPAHECDRYGHAEGMLVGGNMITFEILMDTDYDVTSLDGTILFIEEVEESMHAIDRLFNLLKLRGRIPHFNGIIFGEFTDCGKDLPYEDVEHMLRQYTAGLGIPVCNGFQSGHDKVNLPLIMGADVVLDVTPDGTTLKYKL